MLVTTPRARAPGRQASSGAARRSAVGLDSLEGPARILVEIMCDLIGLSR